MFRRVEGSPWLLSEADGLDGSVELTSIGYVLRLAELYELAIANDETGLFEPAAG